MNCFRARCSCAPVARATCPPDQIDYPTPTNGGRELCRFGQLFSLTSSIKRTRTLADNLLGTQSAQSITTSLTRAHPHIPTNHQLERADIARRPRSRHRPWATAPGGKNGENQPDASQVPSPRAPANLAGPSGRDGPNQKQQLADMIYWLLLLLPLLLSIQHKLELGLALEFDLDPSKPNERPAGLADDTQQLAPIGPARTNAKVARQDTIDEDLVISSSEILFSSLPMMARGVAGTSTDAASGVHSDENCTTLATPPQASLANGSLHESGGPIGVPTMPPISDDLQLESESVAQQSSRLLLQLLVLGLFTLVSASLILVYAVKFCVCQRRKRMLRRALVGDMGAGEQLAGERLAGLGGTYSQHQTPESLVNLAECACGSSALVGRCQPPVSSLIQSLLLGRVPTYNQNPASEPPIWLTPCRRRQQQASQVAVHLQQVAALAQLQAQLQSLAAAAATGTSTGTGTGTSTSTGSCVCSAPGGTGQPATPAVRPPPYSDLFGVVVDRRDGSSQGRRQAAASSSPGASPARASADTSGRPGVGRQQLHHLTASPTSTSGVSPLSASSLATSSANTQASNSEQVNLLVRLNLNKTKLLSAADLMLLSKLIDVPIVIQQSESSGSREQCRRTRSGPAGDRRGGVEDEYEDEYDDGDDADSDDDNQTTRGWTPDDGEEVSLEDDRANRQGANLDRASGD